MTEATRPLKGPEPEGSSNEGKGQKGQRGKVQSN